jgi:hypothetical protein
MSNTKTEQASAQAVRSALPPSILVKRQRRKLGPKVYTEHGEKLRIFADVRYDDECGNGHNTFSITADIQRAGKNGHWYEHSGGCCHGEIVKHFPELAPLIKWHLVSSDGPMHYPGNVIYLAGDRDCWRHVLRWKNHPIDWGFEVVKVPESYGEGKARELDAARNSAVWPEATDEELSAEPEVLKENLLARLPSLMAEFKADIEKFGFIY